MLLISQGRLAYHNHKIINIDIKNLTSHDKQLGLLQKLEENSLWLAPMVISFLSL